MTTDTPPGAIERISEANDAAHRIAQLRASLAILKANPGMSVPAIMATGPDGEAISVHDAGATCFCFVGRIARDHAPVAVYDDDAIYHWLDNFFFKPLGGDMSSNVSGRFMSFNDSAETVDQRFSALENYIDTLEAKFVHGQNVDIYA